MASVIYAVRGQQPANPVNQTARCNQCEPTFALVGVDDLVYDTEADARTTAQNAALRRAIFQAIVPQLWTALWNNFRCTNAQCGNKQACGRQPTHLAIGARTVPVPPPAGNLKWQIMVGLAREIQCVPAVAMPDVEPQIPDTEALETPIILAALDERRRDDEYVVTTTQVAVGGRGTVRRRTKSPAGAKARKGGRKQVARTPRRG